MLLLSLSACLVNQDLYDRRLAELTGDDDGGTDCVRTWYADADRDGFGAAAYTVEDCAAPEGYVDNADDCDDGDADAHPDGTEVCGGGDEDCDGAVDEDDAADALVWYADADGDGYGNPQYATTACAAPAGYVDNAADCADTEPAVNPDGAEVCGDGLDDDCDGGSNGCGVEGEHSLGEADVVIEGEGGGFGYVILPVGSGLAIGAHGVANAAGQVVEYANVFDEVPTTTVNGIEPGEQAGFALSLADDATGDGTPDLFVGAPGSTAAGTQSGAAYLIDGALSGSISVASAQATIVGPEPYSLLGAAITGGPDLDGDGVPGTIVAAPFHGTAGRLFLFDGVLSGEIPAETATVQLSGGPSDYLGLYGVATSDLDADGIDDVVAGAPELSDGVGGVYVFAGPFSGVQTTAEAAVHIAGIQPSAAMGAVVQAPGDLDGDGYGDLLVGAPYLAVSSEAYAGGAYLFRGPFLLDGDANGAATSFLGTHAGDAFGNAFAVLDLDDDGNRDVVVGASGLSPSDDPGDSFVAIFRHIPSGVTTVDDCDARFAEEYALDEAGNATAAGDVDGDGFADLAVGAPGATHGGTEQLGAVFLIFGTNNL